MVIVRKAFLYIQIVVLRQKCRTKFSDYAGKPYSIGISANGEILLFHRTDVFISAWKLYIIGFYVRSIQPCIIISIRGFMLIFFVLWWYDKDIRLLIFIAQNYQNVYWNLRKASVFQDLIAIKFHFKMDYDIYRQATNNSLGSHEYRQLRQWWIIPSNLKSSSVDTIKILQS